jgi:hypothetical protein
MIAMDDSGIEVIMFAHSQGNFLGGCIASILRAVAYAEARGLKVALTAILHAPTPFTLKMAKQFLDARWEILDLPTASIDHARNAALLASRRQFAAFVDGDDLWCETWLHAAYQAAITTRAVWRPEVLLTFGNDFNRNEGYSAVFQPLHLSSPALLLVGNPLPSGFVVSRDILAKHPWPSTNHQRGWNAVDQWWSCEVAAGGYEHRALASTFHYRRCRDALLIGHQLRAGSSEGRIGPTRLSAIQVSHLAFTARAGFQGPGDTDSV